MKFWQVDSFTQKAFRGNPAAVVVSEKELAKDFMQQVAAEMNLSETAFVVLGGDRPQLRWFTPKVEVDLCGHATLAAAHVLLSELKAFSGQVVFETQLVGPLVVDAASGAYTMNFPSRPGREINVQDVPQNILRALSSDNPIKVLSARDMMFVYADEASVRKMNPDFSTLRELNQWVIVTSAAREFDFVSRFFCAGDGIDEDPVTGSAHCTLTPYWAHVLGKTKLHAFQASERGGELHVELREDRVFMTGYAVTVLEGRLVSNLR